MGHKLYKCWNKYYFPFNLIYNLYHQFSNLNICLWGLKMKISKHFDSGNHVLLRHSHCWRIFFKNPAQGNNNLKKYIFIEVNEIHYCFMTQGCNIIVLNIKKSNLNRITGVLEIQIQINSSAVGSCFLQRLQIMSVIQLNMLYRPETIFPCVLWQMDFFAILWAALVRFMLT